MVGVEKEGERERDMILSDMAAKTLAGQGILVLGGSAAPSGYYPDNRGY